MEKLTFDSGIRTYRVGAGVLKFNPTDPNVYARFLDALDQLAALEEELAQSAADGPGTIALLRGADEKVKAILSRVFGPGNDLDAVFSGVSLLAVGANGERLLTNFLAVMEPVLSEGARRCAAAELKKAQ